MNTTPLAPPPAPVARRPALLGTPLGWILSLGLAALGAYLLAYHLNHVALALPYLLLMACPLMHLFGHGGHGHGHGHGGHRAQASERAPRESSPP